MLHRMSWMLGVSGAFLLASSPPASAQEPPLSRYELRAQEPVQHNLPRRLREISGLAVAGDGRVFGHGDERALIYELDYERGEVLKAFSLGHDGIPGDFEGMAVVGDRFFLVTSLGTVYEFREGNDGGVVAFHGYPTTLADSCEVEGLVHDPVSDALLLLCKDVRGLSSDVLVVFAFSLSGMALDPDPWLETSLASLEDLDLDDGLHPSGIEYDRETDTFLIVAAQEESIIALSRDGTVLGALELRRRNHPQTEGIALAADGTLILADEGGGDRARLTLYPRMR